METRRLSEETSLKNGQLEDLRNEGDAYRHEVRLLVSYLLPRSYITYVTYYLIITNRSFLDRGSEV